MTLNLKLGQNLMGKTDASLVEMFRRHKVNGWSRKKKSGRGRERESESKRGQGETMCIKKWMRMSFASWLMKFKECPKLECPLISFGIPA